MDARRGLSGPRACRCKAQCRFEGTAPVCLAGRRAGGHEQQAELNLLGKLNHLSGIDYPDDPGLRARIKSYELAFGMQTAVPEVLDLKKESTRVRSTYGLEDPTTRPFGELCLAARRLV